MNDTAVSLPVPSVAPLARKPLGAQEPSLPSPYTPPAPPTHGEHTKRDAVDHALEEQRRKDNIIKAEREMKQMQGFVRVHKCGRCGKRIKAATDADGNTLYGTCPYCKQGTVPQASTHYAGNDNHRTDPHLKLNDNRFTEGAKGTGGFQTRFSPRARR